MRVVHLALTPVAGSPWNIVAALNAHTDVRARLVVLNSRAYGPRVFAGDLDWSEDRDACRRVIAEADVIHMHQFFDPAGAFDAEVGALCARKVCVRQYHSVPSHFVGDDPAKVAWLLADSTPQLVIGQFHERYFPRARIVPNLLPINSTLLSPARYDGALPRVAWSPSVSAGAWEARWATKGFGETRALLDHLAEEGLCAVDTIVEVAHHECLARKRQASLVVDDLVTGSYHLSGLEGLAQGKPVLGWLDERTGLVLREMTGAADLPWINTRLEDASDVLRALLADPALMQALGDASRTWMETWYDDRRLVGHYVKVYHDLLERPDLFMVGRDNDIAAHWRNVTLPDLLWQSRRDRWMRSAS